MTTTNDIISKALSILKGHDFYWMMDDYAYTNGTMESAKANMKYFVETIKQLPTDLYNLMKNLWMAEYNYCGCFRPCWTSDKAPQYKEKKEKLYAEVEAILNPIPMVA
ncbi:MAG: hypothetical protein NC301_02845 [Bacteroides sp.]|nr:hypothetical protein [Lachnospiraceae bacterium]MCM1309948.1 hypothetical protein [Bacteroides sp.]MCM1379670.1 hypothetical protein [Bacteroides sp.]MCM1445948.1 hypothetical protein [Prevotella sp.]